ncbi:SGNH/GDSL hydrolase family protein [Neolewinella antarctica]|uniref:Lysophospholipase L1-like esterase n=1 Tax=Neolewinella antarctica TaxID=442734 RepID=A0ABX0XAB5_9BACT|nr:GDSL-type esterase/lipase family protein [Neolewinella antarctica]NJC26214.1 lysophospholipase L1-like esterase [Neolewinella antarctica]
MNRILTLVLGVLTLLLAACNPPLGKKNLLVIGDSNGVGEGWVAQLQQLRGGGGLYNTSLSGNTIGFNYGGDLSMNTLENLTSYLRNGYAELGSIDEILIGLGTNDCKVEFTDRHGEIGTNLETLLDRTATFFTERGQEIPRIVILAPAPLDDTDVSPNFAGATACTKRITETYRQIATDRGHCFVDLQTNPGPAALEHSDDGVHFRKNKKGYVMIAEAVLESCY